MLPQAVAQLPKKDLRTRLAGLQDERGMGLDAMRGSVAAGRLGRELPTLTKTRIPSDRAGRSDSEPFRSPATRAPGRDGRNDTLT